MSVHKDKKRNTWYVKYRNTTKRGFNTKKEAQRYEAEMKNNRVSLIDMYYSQVAKHYLDCLKEKTKYSTYDKCRQVIENYILKTFPDKKMSTIDAQDCWDFWVELNHSDYSTSYKNYILQKFKVVFLHAREFCNYLYDPTIALQPFKKTLEEENKLVTKSSNIWTSDDFDKFIEKVDDLVYKAFFSTLYYTGGRLGEIRALKWSDFSDGKIRICKQVSQKTENRVDNRKEEILVPKTPTSIRTISVGNYVNDILHKLKEEEQKRIGFNEDWYIFGGPRTLPTTSIDRKRNNAIRLSGVSYSSNHDMRHAHITELISSGANFVSVGKRVGHKTPRTTLDVYTHAKNIEDEALLEILNSSQNTSEEKIKL